MTWLVDGPLVQRAAARLGLERRRPGRERGLELSLAVVQQRVDELCDVAEPPVDRAHADPPADGHPAA